MKKCFKCHQTKPLDEFYRHPQMGDGHLNKCKECAKRDVREHSRTPEGREYERRRKFNPKRKEQQRANARRMWQRHKDKYTARQQARRAVLSGKIQRLPCAVCGDPRSEGHHVDYSRPLDVRWLCSLHHKAVHLGEIVV